MYDVSTSQEAQASTACYGDSFTLVIYMMLVPHRKHKPPLSVTEDSFTLLICMMFVPHRKHKAPLSVPRRASRFALWNK
jgi:hypothetical protein